MTECEHNWWVYSTSVVKRWMLVKCYRCGSSGTVDPKSSDEWAKAYRAPSDPYHWPDNERVVIND